MFISPVEDGADASVERLHTQLCSAAAGLRDFRHTHSFCICCAVTDSSG